MGWQTPWAPAPEELSACIECGLCLPHCPTYRLTGDESASPRGRLNAMAAVASGELDVDEAFADVMGFCLQCRACEPACPSMVPFGRAMEGARAEVGWAHPTPTRAIRRSILGTWLARPWAVRLATWGAGLVRRFGLTRGLPSAMRLGLAGLRPSRTSPSLRGTVHDPDGEAIADVGLLAGCVMDPWFPDVHASTVRVLTAAGYRVVVPGAQTCCGALAAHDGAAWEAERLAAINVEAFGRVDLVVTDAAGCGAHLKDYVHWSDDGEAFGAKVRDVTELVAAAIENGLLPRLPSRDEVVAVQDPCHLRHAQRITDQPRDVVRAAGYEVVDVDDTGMCCGAAGVYSVMHPETSSELGRAKAVEVERTGATIVASANPGCEMQLRSHLDGRHRIVHPIELYAEALAGSS